MIRSASLLLSLLCVLAVGTACSKRSGPLPGDSVSDDGGITLSPPKLSTTPKSEDSEPRLPRGPLGAIESLLFPPEIVMEHQGELGIDAKQREAIVREVERSQSEMVRLQWDLQGEKEKLVKVLEADRIDERASAEAGAKVMERETRVKAAHLAMLVRVKNLLTNDQKQKLRALREGPRPTAPASSDAGPVDGSAPK